MNYSTALFLINKNLRAVLATYESDDRATKVMYKTLDPTIKVGDYVIVPTKTRHNMTVVKITDIDVQVDFDSDAQVNLIIGKIDKSNYDILVAQEQQALDTIRSAEAANKRDELKKKLFAHSQEQIKQLPIYANGE